MSDVRILGYSLDVREIVAGTIELRPSERREARPGASSKSISVVFGGVVRTNRFACAGEDHLSVQQQQAASAR